MKSPDESDREVGGVILAWALSPGIGWEGELGRTVLEEMTGCEVYTCDLQTDMQTGSCRVVGLIYEHFV